ncbi:autotransporter domain-containing protein [Escherichia ruysiae]|uniref:BigA/YdbA N-terminal beta-barrel domain-containing protein n=1 Tax=Escherichia ruysiae TaxID=2608867 RepID=UPI001C9B1672|nr:autotransporter domain-containing protein [Escherichia ruysiae]MBY7351630.1 autotransporter domain-containing protein [Escherichia ruysiae]
MQRKKLLSVCVAMALSSQTWAADTTTTESADETRKSSKISCPENIQILNKEQLEHLPAECIDLKDSAVLPWAAAGLAAVVTGVAVYALHDDNNHHDDPSPVPDDGGNTPVPPDDGGDTPVPPDDGGDTPVPPDDGDDTPIPPDDGDDTPIPPDDGGDTPVPPDDGGDTPVPPDDGGDTPVPPDDGGDTPVPPDDGGDTPVPPDDGGDTPVPPDDGGDTPVPPDDGGDTPVPPDDGGDAPVPPDDKPDPIKFNNNVTWDQAEKTVQIRNATFTYTENADGSYTLTAKDGRQTIVKQWKVNEDSNTAVFEGVNKAGGIIWSYDDEGKIHITKEAGVVVDGTTGNDIKVSDAIITDQGGNTALNGGTVMTVEGDNIVLNNDGKTTAIGEGSVVGILTGDDITINNNGETEVDGGTAVIVNGDSTTINTQGDAAFTHGGTGSLINGDEATIDNKGNMTVDGENSAATKIVGNDALIKQEGDLYVSDAAHGIDVTGNGTIVSNKGNITVVDDKSIGVLLDGSNATFMNIGDITVGDTGREGNPFGVLIDGDNATFVNVGDITTNNSGTGIKVAGNEGSVSLSGKMSVNDATTGLEVNGNDNSITMTTYELSIAGENATGVNLSGNGNNLEISGDMTVDGKNTVGTRVMGDDVSVLQNGDLYVSGAAHGIDIQGTRAKISNTGKITVIDNDSVGVLIEGDDEQFGNIGEIDVSQNGTGISLIGDREQVSLYGDINVTQERDDSGNFQGATGISIAGNDSQVTLEGDVNLTSDMGSSPTESDNHLNGLVISGDNNTISLNGSLNIEAYSSFFREQPELDGVVVAGDDNVVNLNGGVNISGDTGGHGINGIYVSGDSVVNISGHSVLDITSIRGATGLIYVTDGGSVVLDENSVTDVFSPVRDASYYGDNSTITADGIGSSAENKGEINALTAKEIIFAINGASVINSGTINIKTVESSVDDGRTGVVRANGKNSSASNASGGVVNITSSLAPSGANGNPNYPLRWYYKTYYALLASDYGDVINQAGAVINLHGAGTYGVSATKGTATNIGEINVNGFIPTLDENGNTISETYWQTSTAFLMGGGMLAGSTDTSVGDATGLNTGTINVKNEGFGMLALNGGTAVNQGTINLTADENVTKQQDNQLFAMGAIGSGVAINDKTGVINIDTDVGQAFYTEGSGTIINYGTICTLGICENSGEYNPTDPAVSQVYSGGDTFSTEGQSTNFAQSVVITNTTPDSVINSGTISGPVVTVLNGELENTATGIINNLIKLNEGGEVDNAGTLSNIDIDGGTLNNDGTVSGQITMYAGKNTSQVNNNGTINKLVQKVGVFNNSGTVTSRIDQQNGIFNNQKDGIIKHGSKLTNNAVVNNDGTWILGNSSEDSNAGMLEIDNNAVFNNHGEFILDNNKNAVHINQSGTLYNTGHMSLTNSSHNGAVNIWGGNGRFINNGKVDSTAKSVVVSASNAAATDAFFWNMSEGEINFDHDNASAVKFTHTNYVAQNDGTMNISGNNTVAMEGNNNAQLVNKGIINLGTEGTTDTGLIGMQLDANATADAVIENNGTINIYANDSYAFSVLGTNGHVVNNGTVVIADGVTGSGLIKQGGSVNVEGINGNNGNSTEVHYGDYTLPDVPNTTVTSFVDNTTGEESGTNSLNGYVVGTNADGSAGKLKVNNASMSGVEINTGFAAGTADTTVTFDNVVQGSNLTDADAITSTSVVWNAQGSTDASGNVDVTMNKNAYTDVATDASVNDVAQALDAGYTNNELYTSLNVGTTAELNSALKQISGSQATTVFREARVLSNRFSMLADAAPKVGNGLAFNVVAKGDPRAELGNDTQYDMLALRKTLDLSESQSLSLEYGIARLDGNGSDTAGDNGVTGGYSQFFGLKHQMAFENGISWNNALRYDVHNLDSSRAVAYGDVSKTADTNVKQQYLEFRSEGAKTFEPREGLKITPYAGVKLRHTLEGGYQERNAGDFNLNMNSGSETAVDGIVGLKLDYAGKDGWSANATLEGGPNLSYAKSQRTASLAGAGSQYFNVDDGQKGGGINSQASVGVKYSSKESSLHLDAYHWKEDGISDKGVMLNFKKTF